MAGLKLRGREAEVALVVAHHRVGDVRAVLAGADDHAFHRTFLGGRHLAGQRGGLSGGRMGQQNGKSGGQDRQ